MGGEQPQSGNVFEGIDFYAYYAPAKGLFFCGWIPDPGPLRDRPQEVIARFEGFDVPTGLLQAFYHREDLHGAGIGFVASFLEHPFEPSAEFVSLEIRFSNALHKVYPSKGTLRLRDRELAERLNRILAGGKEDSHPQRMQALLPQARAEQPKPATVLNGVVDFYGYQSIAGGWLFCGWVSEGWREDLRLEKFIAFFENGDVIGEPVAAIYPRNDLGDGCEGVALFVHGPAGPLGSLCSLSFEVNGLRWTLKVGTPIHRLREQELIGRVRTILAGAPLSPPRDTLMAFLNRQPYAGQDTLATLADKFFLDIDEAIFCGNDSVLLIGWCLAKRDVVRNITLRSGHLASSLNLGDCLWVDRPDVLANVGAKHGYGDPRCGFIVFLPHSVTANGRVYIEVETKRGEIGFRTVPVPKLEGIAAIKSILARFELRFIDVPESYNRVIGPAIEMLNRSRLSVKPYVDVLDYGAVPGRPKFSVIVPLYGRLDFVEYQLGLFSAHERNKTVEFIYVLDDPSKRTEAQFLFNSIYERFRVPFRVLLLDRNVGFGPANNIGLDVANGSYVAFVNSDVFPETPDWLERLAAHLVTHPELGAIGPLLLFEDGSVQHQGMYFKPLSEFGNFFFGQHFAKGLRYTGGPGLRTCISITGACMVMERSLARKVGGFDEAYVLGDFEDTDLCLKLLGMGLQCAVDPEVQLYHLERKSQESAASAWRMNLSLYNAWVHHRRWASAIAAHSAGAQAASMAVVDQRL